MQGGTTFHFVTDGIESALAQACTDTGGKDVTLGGGGSIIQQYLAAGPLDEIALHVVPLLSGRDERLLDRLDADKIKSEPIRTVEDPGITHLNYRTIKDTAQ